MSSLWFAFGAMICWGAGDFFIQKTVKRVGIFASLFWMCCFAVILLSPLVIPKLSLLNSFQIKFLISSGLLGFIGAWLHFKALRIGKLAVIETIVGLEMIITVFLGIIGLQELLSWWQAWLILIVLGGTILLTIDFTQLKNQNFWEKGSGWALVGAIFFAASNFMMAYGAQRVFGEVEPLLAIWLPWLVTGFLALIIILAAGQIKSFWQKSRQYRNLLFIMVIIDLAAWLFFLFSVTQSPLSLSIAIAASYPAVAAILGLFYNQEKLSKWQLSGLIMALLAGFMIAWLS